MNHQNGTLRVTVPRPVPALLMLTAIALPAAADCGSDGPFEDGARCLFVGHSFFVPVAIVFDSVAATNDFPLHQMDTVFRGGPAGSPQALWDDAATRAEIEAVLATGEVELFGLTSFSPENSDFDDYALWIDLALRYNPDTRFFIGNPWVPGGPSLNTQSFDSANETTAYETFEVVDQLRAAYPGERIEYVSYGKAASIMKGMFENGVLPDIVGLTPEPRNGVPASAALFADPLLGHAGPMLTELAALTWMDVLYGAEIETVVFTEYQSDVASIVSEVLEFNEPFVLPASKSADLAEAFDVLDINDVLAFANAFNAQQAAADLFPDGMFDINDVLAFATAFNAGCP